MAPAPPRPHPAAALAITHSPLRAPCSLLPLNYTFYDPTTVTTTDTTTNTTTTDTISNTFLRMTMSSVPTHSRILWCAARCSCSTHGTVCEGLGAARHGALPS